MQTDSNCINVFALLSNFMSQAWKHDPVIKPPGLSIRNNHETNVYVRGSGSRAGAGQTHLSCASANPALGYLVLFRQEETRSDFRWLSKPGAHIYMHRAPAGND